jgi:glucosyl-3-phosphoglycerate phosphatase
MPRLLLLRHAQSEWNAAGRWQGWSDAPLSRLGRRQAHQAGLALARDGVTAALVATSDLQRARLTASLIADEMGYDRPMHVDAALREHDVGRWNGLTTDEINYRWPGLIDALGERRLDAFPGGESLNAFCSRVQRGVLRLALLAFDHGGDVIAITHGGALTALEHWLGVWLRDRRHPNLSGWWLSVRGDRADLALKPLAPVQLLPAGTASAPPSGVAAVGAAAAGAAVTEVA